jgi:hypothetical protein
LKASQQTYPQQHVPSSQACRSRADQTKLPMAGVEVPCSAAAGFEPSHTPMADITVGDGGGSTRVA